MSDLCRIKRNAGCESCVGVPYYMAGEFGLPCLGKTGVEHR